MSLTWFTGPAPTHSPDPRGDSFGQTPGSSREPGDGFVIAGALLGVALGGALGFFVSRDIGGLFIEVLCAAGGALLLGSVGALLGEKVKARMAKPKGKDLGGDTQ